LTGERAALDAEEQAAVHGIALIGQHRQSTGAFDGGS
jgi:hypothetical protein